MTLRDFFNLPAPPWLMAFDPTASCSGSSGALLRLIHLLWLHSYFASSRGKNAGVAIFGAVASVWFGLFTYTDFRRWQMKLSAETYEQTQAGTPPFRVRMLMLAYDVSLTGPFAIIPVEVSREYSYRIAALTFAAAAFLTWLGLYILPGRPPLQAEAPQRCSGFSL
jgi:hypothetical protein